ncbi:hypothetical protein ACH5RR_034782 [Cinchona calisaya]|uniref:Uncharacterized protein n=1 Tax=Cinchona calisaya TaxID=153742 RepID=A0ABD2YE04_9GENT
MPRIVLRSLDRSSSAGVWCLGVLARNHPFVAKILLEFGLPRSVLQESVTSGQKGKIVMVVEEDELQKRQQREGDVSCKGKMISKNLHISKGIRCYGKVRLVTNIQELFYLYLSVVMIVAAVDVEESLGAPRLVSRCILETLTYLARNHPFVAKILLEFRLPRSVLQESVTSGQKGKTVMVVEEDEFQKRQQREGDVSCKGKMISKNLHISKGIRCYGKVRLVTNIQELFYLYLSVVMIVAAVDVEESLAIFNASKETRKLVAAYVNAAIHSSIMLPPPILADNKRKNDNPESHNIRNSNT